MVACTIIARNYLAHARVLARSFLDHHPESQFIVLVLDAEAGVPAGDEPFEVISPYEIGIERSELHRMAMIYDVLELATAVKPWLLQTLLDGGATDVIYFDPDIEIFAPLDDISTLAREHSIVLIPHVMQPMPRDGREPSETTILYSGVYNLGFIAVGARACDFLAWWSERLARECIVAPSEHRFVDQRWVDFVPGMFEHRILRDPGCDVAHWNLWGRSLEWNGERYTVDGAQLRFYHFSGFDPDRPELLSKHQGLSPRVLIEEIPALGRLCAAYARKLFDAGYRDVSSLPYWFDSLPGGILIDRDLRRTYRAALVEAEQTGPSLPPDAFDPDAARDFAAWLRAANGTGHGARLRPGVNVAGYLRAELGIGEAARQVLTALERAGVPYSALAYREATHSRQDHPAIAAPNEPVYDTNLICVNADGMARFAATVGAEFFEGRYSIGLWWWEVSVFPPSMHPGFAYVDEIWVGSEHAREAIAAQTTKPVVKVPMPVSVPPARMISRAELRLPEGFLFLFTYDFFSVLERKNPLGLIQAFRRAFAPGEGPKLVLKSINGDIRDRDLQRVRDAASDHPDIIVWDEYVTADDKDAMAASCDCYVSLHRSEGFGLTLAEAMVYGKPVIATAYSGNLEFMDEENSYLVPYRQATVPEGCDPYPHGAEWAEPDLDAAAALMRHVFEHPEEAAARAARGRDDVLSRHDPARAGNFMRERLEETRRNRPPVLAGDLLRRTTTEDSPLRRAVAALTRVPTSLAPPNGRRDLASIVRKVALRVIWPYIRQQQELNGTLVEALATLNEAYARQGEALSALSAQASALAAQLETAAASRREAEIRAALGPLPIDPELKILDEQANELIGFRGADPGCDDWYGQFEDVFRGPEELIKERQRPYVEILRDRGPILDVGCGRGEFLELLRDAGIEARGIDVDAGMVARARAKALDVEEADAVDYLDRQENESLGAIFCAHVIEHLPYERLLRFVDLCQRKLAPDGMLIAETVNPHSIVAFRAFWRDPTHQAPIYPEVALVLCRIHGFETGSVYFPTGAGDLETDLRDEPDYAVIARRAPDPAVTAEVARQRRAAED